MPRLVSSRSPFSVPFTRRRLLGLAAVAGIGLSVNPAGAASSWRLATPYPEGNFQTLTTQIFAEDLRQASSGRMAVDVYPNASLFPFDQIAPAVMGGEIEMGEIQLSWLGPWLPAAEVDSVPFLASNYSDARRLWGAARAVFLRVFARLGLVPLQGVPWPPVGLASRMPLSGVGDLAGRRFLAISPITRRFAEAVGAQAVEVPPTRVAAAFAAGEFDALFAPVVEGLARFQGPVSLYYYDVGAWLPMSSIVMNASVYETLSSRDQELLLQVAESSEARGWDASRLEYERRLSTLASLGAAVEPPSAQLMADLRDIGQSLAIDWLARAGFDGEDILRGYRI